jgi:hypothetical protein
MKVFVPGNGWCLGVSAPTPMTSPMAPALLLTALLGSACEPGGAALPQPLVRDSMGVRILETPVEALDLPAPIRVHPEPHLRVGAMDGPPEALLTQPRWAERLSDGRIFVVETAPVPGRLLRPDGTFDRWVGRMGEGPGEFQRAGGGGVLPGDTLWVRDLGNQQFSLFGPDGAFVRRVDYTRPTEAFQPRRAWLLPGGGILDEGGTMNFGDVIGTPGPFQEEVLVHALPAPGEAPILLLRVPGLRYRSGTFTTSDGSQAPMVTQDGPIFSAPPRVRPVPGGGFWLVDGGAFEARRYDADGRLRVVTRTPARGDRVTAALEDAYWTRVLEDAAPELHAPIRERRRETEWPSTLPPIREILVDDQGRLWLGEFSLHRFRPPEVWWVVEPERGVLGRVEVPPGLTLLSIADGELLGVERDGFDVPYLVAHRLEEG